MIHNTPEQDGVSEHLNQTITEIGQALLIGSGLPKFLWAKVFNHTAWLKNRVLHATMGTKAPNEAATGTKPDPSGLWEFSSTICMKAHGVDKLDVQINKGRFVGFDEESKGIRVYWPGNKESQLNVNSGLIPM